MNENVKLHRVSIHEWTHQSLTHSLLCWKCCKNQKYRVEAHSTGSYLLLCNRKRVYPWLPLSDPYESSSKHRSKTHPSTEWYHTHTHTHTKNVLKLCHSKLPWVCVIFAWNLTWLPPCVDYRGSRDEIHMNMTLLASVFKFKYVTLKLHFQMSILRYFWTTLPKSTYPHTTSLIVTPLVFIIHKKYSNTY